MIGKVLPYSPQSGTASAAHSAHVLASYPLLRWHKILLGALSPIGQCRRSKAMELHSSSRPRRALIVEDEIVIALDLQDAMSAMGFDQCELASSDRKARSLAMGSQPDVALVDVCLDGGRDGIEAARWLREVCEVPVVFVTGCDDPATIERIHDQVPDAPVLTKPEYRRGLADAIAEVTAHRMKISH